MDRQYLIPTKDLVQVARGFLMGGADVIPGVSGGTVALIVGIYSRLVTAISHFDARLLSMLAHRDWRAAAAHVDFRFLVALGSGIAMGILSLASAMHYLLDHHLAQTYAAFSGLILASSFLVGRVVGVWRFDTVSLLLFGMVGAYLIVGLSFMQSPPDHLGYIFLCGAIGICAMILPGISGAFILLIMGKYIELTGLLKDLLRGQVSLQALVTIAVFVSGMALGLIGFSKVLRWLLKSFPAQTMAVLCGFMVGSLRKLWPFKQELTPAGTKFKLREFANHWPTEYGAEFWSCLGLVVIAATLVLVLDRLTREPHQNSNATPNATAGS